MSKTCLGCGVKLQFEDKDAKGYVREDKYDTADYCESCFKLMHYGVAKKDEKPKSRKEIIKYVNDHAKDVIFLVSFIDIFDETINIFKSIKVPKTLIISKSDIIPKNVSFDEIKKYLRKIYGIKENIIFTSNKSNLNTFMKSLYNKKEVYFLGLTNSGKSTLINKLIDLTGDSSKKLTTSYKENTTKDFIKIKLNNLTVVDSPGFVIDNFELDKNTNISKEIKPITYQNKLPCTFKIGDLFKTRIDGKSSIVFYFSKNIKIERLYDNKVIGTTFSVSKNSDVVICGLGFIKTTDDIKITIPKDLIKYVNVRPSIVGGKY